MQRLAHSLAISIMSIALPCFVAHAEDSNQASWRPPGASSTQPKEGLRLPAADGRYTAVLSAEGEGCPEGSWSAHFAEPGVIELAFDANEARLEPSQQRAVVECDLSLRLEGEASMSFALQWGEFRGSASLDAGVRAALTHDADLFFGRPTSGIQELLLTGPFQGDFATRPAPRVADLIYSPCGRSAVATITTRLELRAGERRGRGTLRLDELGGIRIGARVCPPPG